MVAFIKMHTGELGTPYAIMSFKMEKFKVIENSTTWKISSCAPPFVIHVFSISSNLLFLRWQLRKLTRQFIKEMWREFPLAIFILRVFDP